MMLPPGRFANVEFELPTLRVVSRYTPDFQRAELVNASLEPYGHNPPLLAIHVERHFHGTEFLNLAFPVFQQGTGVILFADAGTEESKFNGLTNDKTKLAVRNRGFGAFLHAKGNDAKCFEWSFHTRDSGHGALDSNVVTAGGATADAYAVTSTCFAVVSCTARYSVLQVRCFQYLFCPKRIISLLLQPAVQHLNHAVAQHGCFHHAAVEQQVRRTCHSAASSPNVGLLRTIASLLGQEAREVPGDRGVGRVGQA